jgi:hypothetical protein
MIASEPRVRHRGFFLHSDSGDTDATEHDNPEGFNVRAHLPRTSNSHPPRAAVASGRSRTDAVLDADEGRPAIRSGSVTGSRQRSHLPR